jgi:YD repeat-containing protein
MVLSTPDGSTHELRPLGFEAYPGVGNQGWRKGFYKDTPDSTGQPMRYYSYDGSFLWAVIYPQGGPILWEVHMLDGTSITQSNLGQHIKDTRGNTIEIISTTNLAGDVTTTCKDLQTGRQISYTFTAADNTGVVEYRSVNNTPQTITIKFENKPLVGKAINAGDRHCLSWGTLINDNYLTITSIVLPETEPNITRELSFEYNSDTIDTLSQPIQFKSGCSEPVQQIFQASRGCGELSRVTLPSGAVSEYIYKRDGEQNTLATFRFAARMVAGNTLQQKRLLHDGVTDVWDYTINSVSGQVSGPDGTLVKEEFFQKDTEFGANSGGTNGFEGLVYRTTRKQASNNQNVTIQERRWAMKKFDGGVDDAPNGVVAFNPIVTSEFTTLCDDEGDPSQMSARKFDYDFNGNQTSVAEYGFFDPDSVLDDPNGVPFDVPEGLAPVRTITSSFYNAAPTAASSNVYAKRGIGNPPTPRVLSAIKQTTNGAAQSRFSYDGQAFENAPTAGLITREEHWDNGIANGGTPKWIPVTYVYDSFGNKSSITDPRNNITTLVYDSQTHAQPVSITVDPLNQTGQQTSSTSYDFSTGLVLTQTDVNGKVTTFDYTNQLLSAIDPLGRVGVVTGPAVAS